MAKEFDYREYLAEGWLFKDRGISVDKVKDRLMKIYKSKYGDNDTIKGHVAVEFDDEDGNPSGEYVYIQPDSIEYHADRQAAGVPIDKWDDEIVNAVWKNLKKKKYFPVGVEENLNEEESQMNENEVEDSDLKELKSIVEDYRQAFRYNGIDIDKLPEEEYTSFIEAYSDEPKGFECLGSAEMVAREFCNWVLENRELGDSDFEDDMDECDAGLMNEADRAIALFHKRMNS